MTDWKRAIKISVLAYQMIPHCAIGVSLFLMLYGREPMLPQEVPFVKFDSPIDYNLAVKNHIPEIICIHDLVMAKNIQYKGKMKEFFDKKKKTQHFSIVTFEVGELVWMDVCRRVKDSSKSTLPNWVGPCLITSKTPGPLSYKERTNGVVSTKFERVNTQFLKIFKEELW